MSLLSNVNSLCNHKPTKNASTFELCKSVPETPCAGDGERGPVHKKSAAFRQRICFPLQQSEQRSIKTFSSLSRRCRRSRERLLYPPFKGVDGLGTSGMVDMQEGS